MTFIDMIPRLIAEESLQAVTVIAIGAGMADKGMSRRVRAQWSQELTPKEPRFGKSDPSLQDLSAIGLGSQKEDA